MVQRIAEGGGFARLVIRAEERGQNPGKIDELMRRGNREGPKDQGVDQRERSRTGADGEGEGRNRGEAGFAVLRDHAQAEAEVAE
ncbi:MAG TPA: hypothetical protein VNV86_12710 [Candidatus Acidoferrum sp.]|nr:hypothetical protein [Candidatus Acidoferrum sp.]